MADNDWHSETRAIRAGRTYNDASLAPVLWPSTTYFNRSVTLCSGMSFDPPIEEHHHEECVIAPTTLFWPPVLESRRPDE